MMAKTYKKTHLDLNKVDVSRAHVPRYHLVHDGLKHSWTASVGSVATIMSCLLPLLHISLCDVLY